jgi:CheY-like chemotaxis protein
MTRPYILLVEDNAQNCYMATYLLESGGYEVACVTTGPEALSSIRRRRPDLLLTDIQLPEMDGYELGSLLRADPQFRDLPMMALTSYAMPGDRQKAFALGFNGYLEKPINPETFVADVRQVLQDHGSAPCAS